MSNRLNIHQKGARQEQQCICGSSCFCCMAESLSITCGSTIESKQYEYNITSKLYHEKHKKTETIEHPSMSHIGHESSMQDPKMAISMEMDIKYRFFISLALIILSSMLMHFSFFTPPLRTIFLLILTTPAVFWTGSIFISGAYYSLKEKKLNMSVLIATSVLTSYGASILLLVLGEQKTYFEAAGMLVTFVLFGHWMEMRSRRGTSDALHALLRLVPPQTTVIKDGKEVSIYSADLIVGDIVLVRPGDKIPIDGVIISGETTIDESLVTGESIPHHKKSGDIVIGGSVNQMGSVQYKVTKEPGNTVLAEIIKLVEKAQTSKAPGQRIADKAAAYLVIIAIGSGVVTFFAWLFITNSAITALQFAVAAIVIACPDALGLATPTVVAVATGLGAQHNILIKNATALEEASKINTIFLDKTGTLTEGKPKVIDIITSPNSTLYEVMHYGGSTQALSNHPFAFAILEKAKELSISLASVTNLQALGGLGLKAIVDNKIVILGSPQLLVDQGIDLASIEQDLNKLMQEGKSVSVVALDFAVIGAFSFKDNVRVQASTTIDGLKKLGIEPIMITGDSFIIAERIANELGIARFFAQILPEHKRNFVKKLQDEGRFVAMVGDGINDAPALAQANIGIAIGAGTDVAIESASIVLMKSNPADILKAITLSKATVRKMKENLFWASIYNIISIPIAAGILYKPFGFSINPEISALLMSLSSIIVALNAISLKRMKFD